MISEYTVNPKHPRLEQLSLMLVKSAIHYIAASGTPPVSDGVLAQVSGEVVALAKARGSYRNC